jgi:hypothetical protein
MAAVRNCKENVFANYKFERKLKIEKIENGRK